MITSPQRAERAPAKRWPSAGRVGCLLRQAKPIRALALLTGVGAAVALGAGPAGAQTAPAPPKPGVTLGVAAEGNERLDMFYTGTDGQVWMVHMSPMGQNIPEPLGGHLIGGPAAVSIPPGELYPAGAMAVFGRGTDNKLWWSHQTSSGWSRWTSLGGSLSSKPTVYATPTFGGAASSEVMVFARGTDGAVWGRTEYARPGQWSPWGSIGGRLLPGTAPAVVGNASGLFVAAAGADRAVWVAISRPGGPGFVWHSIGGRTTASPGISAPSDEAVVAFARGADNAGWSNEFFGQTAGVPAGWQSLHGALTSGVTAITQQEAQVVGPTSVFALGLNNKAWMDSGTWPSLTGWQQVRVGS